MWLGGARALYQNSIQCSIVDFFWKEIFSMSCHDHMHPFHLILKECTCTGCSFSIILPTFMRFSPALTTLGDTINNAHPYQVPNECQPTT